MRSAFPFDAEGPVSRVVLDPVVVTDRDQLLPHLVARAVASAAEGLALLAARRTPVSQSHLVSCSSMMASMARGGARDLLRGG